MAIRPFVQGASYPFRAIGVLFQHPHLLPYLALPLILNLIAGGLVYGGMIFWGIPWLWQRWQGIAQGLEQAIAQLPQWLLWLDYLLFPLGWLLGLLFGLVGLILTGWLIVQFGVILGAPWYGQLSERLEKIRTGRVEAIEVGFLRDIGRALLFELKKLLLLVGIGGPLVVVNFLPGVGSLIATVGGLLLTGTLLCLDFFDSPLERRRLSFRQKLGIIYRHFPSSAGFVLVCLPLVSLPLINLITVPFCLAAGTLWVCDRWVAAIGDRDQTSVRDNVSSG